MGSRISSKQLFENHVRFTAYSEQPAKITVTLGSKTKEVVVDGEKQFDLNFGRFEYDKVRFRAGAKVYVDNISVYNFVQDGQIYDLDGQELPCAAGIRALNQMLKE